MSDFDPTEAAHREMDERCRRGDHQPVVVDVLGMWNPIYVWECSWCREPLYEVPAA